MYAMRVEVLQACVMSDLFVAKFYKYYENFPVFYSIVQVTPTLLYMCTTQFHKCKHKFSKNREHFAVHTYKMVHTCFSIDKFNTGEIISIED